MEIVLDIFVKSNVNLEDIEKLNKELKEKLKNSKVSRYEIVVNSDTTIEKFDTLKILSFIRIKISSLNEELNEVMIKKILKNYDFIKEINITSGYRSKDLEKDIRVNKELFLNLLSFFEKEEKILNKNGENIKYKLKTELFKMQLTPFLKIQNKISETINAYSTKMGLNIDVNINIRNSVNIYIENKLLNIIYKPLLDFFIDYIESFCEKSESTKIYYLDIEIVQEMDTIYINMVDYTNTLTLKNALTKKDVNKIKHEIDKPLIMKKMIGFNLLEDSKYINTKVLKSFKNLKHRQTEAKCYFYKNKYLKFSLELKQTNYILTTYILEINGENYAIDMSSVLEMIDIDTNKIIKKGDYYFYHHDNKDYPIIYLCEYISSGDKGNSCYKLENNIKVGIKLKLDGASNIVIFDKYVKSEEIYVSENIKRSTKNILGPITLSNSNKVKILNIKNLLVNTSD